MNLQDRTANFDRLARSYRWLEYLSFGPLLQRCRCEYLRDLTGCQHALVLGDGDGRFLARLLAAAPGLHADVVDSSRIMLRLLGGRAAALGAGGRVALHHANALSFPPPGSSYDLVVTHFFLDCFEDGEVVELLARIVPHLASGALWVVSDFAIPEASGWRKPMSFAARGLVASLYRAFGLTTGLAVRSLPDYSSSMRGYGFDRTAHCTRLAGLLVSELWTLRRDPAPRSGAAGDSGRRSRSINCYNRVNAKGMHLLQSQVDSWE